MADNGFLGKQRVGSADGRWKTVVETVDDSDAARTEMKEQADLLALSTKLGANNTVLDLTKY